MHVVGGKRERMRQRANMVAAAAIVAGLSGLVGCAGSGTGADASQASSKTTVTSPGSGADASTAAAGPTTTAATATSTQTGFEGATDGPRTAPPDGTGTALLRAVRVGRNVGFERIVFEFEGSSRPGYRIRWIDGPVTADGSGNVVSVAGAAHLEMIMEPASGVDMQDGHLTYTGPDRILVTQQTKLLRDLVRTGDFEAVLTWVAGASRRVPFRVQTLSAPTRLVVDLQD
ncbi:MAG: hypothetical protein JWM89_2968 [Acidimicrobiales bacterium]|nr:hypothetical protein [Acidimicrobiales bacterium]